MESSVACITWSISSSLTADYMRSMMTLAYPSYATLMIFHTQIGIPFMKNKKKDLN